MSKLLQIFIFSLLLCPNYLNAIDDSKIPPSLLEWKDWVLDDVKDIDCPIDYRSGVTQCSWYNKIVFNVDESRLDFNMSLTLYQNASVVTLPHTHLGWIDNIEINGKSVEVLQRGDRAIVILDKGKYNIKGSIPKASGIKYIEIPTSVALVELYKNGTKIPSVKIDNQSRLWLEQSGESSIKKGSLSVSIYRKVIDSHPMKMQTYLDFRVSGKIRSVVLDGVVLEGFLPTEIDTRLNATITDDNKLKVELKAGEWSATISSYAPNNLTALKKPKSKFIYANDEIWTLQSNPTYRTIKIEGVTSIDSSQTTLPSMWKSLPAYLIDEKSIFTIKELYKSATQQQKNRFTLNREMWLDFDGDGYTISDNINAKISQIRRLESSNILDLASVSINGKPTLITSIDKSTQKGVELREHTLNIEASSRYMGNITMPPANGWSEKFDYIKTKINLPPSWRLFASFGSDNDTSSWIDEWTLMHIFLVLLLIIAIYKLYGIKWTLLSAIFIIALWHERDAPTEIWLALVAVISVLRLLDSGRLRKFLMVIFGGLAVVAIYQVLIFGIYEVRTALYPQLESSSYSSYDRYSEPRKVVQKYEDEEGVMGLTSIAPPAPKSSLRDGLRETKYRYMSKPKIDNSYTQMIMQNKIDPNAVVQTGIAKPQWHWHSYSFSWQSGVGIDEPLELWLVPPTLTKIWKVINIMGILFLLYMFLSEFIRPLALKIKAPKVLSNIAILLSILAINPTHTYAQMPSDSMLQELKSKLTTPPICLPNCSSIQSISVTIDSDILKIDMSISAGADISIPTLGNRNSWLPQKILVDGVDTSLNLNRGELWIMLKKGEHKVELSGSLQNQQIVTLFSTMPLRNLSINSDKLWRVKSDDKSYIEITNLSKIKEKIKEESKISPLIHIERRFYFGQRWYIDTKVTLQNSIEIPYTLEYKLLPNESVLNKEIEIKDGKATLHLGGNSRYYQWRSSIPITPNLELIPAKSKEIVEIWNMDVSSIWSIDYSGIESSQHKKVGSILMPSFAPWHKDSLKLSLEKAKAVKGESLTIESSKMSITQSSHYRDIELNLNIKSSKATQYSIELKGVEELKPVIIDNTTHYLKITKDRVTIPLKAKTQDIKLSWREEIASDINYQFPQVNLQKDSTNNSIKLELPYNRWILWTDGPLLGPAVLIWGVLVGLFIFALILGRIPKSPLKTRDWLLLGVGISSSSFMIILPIVAWVFLFLYRDYLGERLRGWNLHLMKIVLVIATLVAIITIVSAISMGLLGNPEMIISGNNSYAHILNWYSDKTSGVLPQPQVITVSVWYYRALMLIWSIWIAFALIRWLKWSWSIFNQKEWR